MKIADTILAAKVKYNLEHRGRPPADRIYLDTKTFMDLKREVSLGKLSDPRFWTTATGQLLCVGLYVFEVLSESTHIHIC